VTNTRLQCARRYTRWYVSASVLGENTSDEPSTSAPLEGALDSALAVLDRLVRHGDEVGVGLLAAAIGPKVFRSASEHVARHILAVLTAVRPSEDRAEAEWWALATVSACRAGGVTRPDHVAPLTSREVEILQLMASGCTNKEIGRRLGVSAKTVMHHAASIYRKLNVSGRTEAVAYLGALNGHGRPR
jgi:DNA-binding CsgD family transcriptional regulator